ncbi:hypothetical protein Xind_03953 [Xenorhabdus indica]|nr:hypothetical protein [Xenorhabdus indica]
MKLPVLAGGQDTFNELSVFVIAVSKGFSGRQDHFSQRTIRVVIESRDPTCCIGFPDDLTVAPLAACDAPQRIDFTDHQPVVIVMILGFTAFSINISRDTGLIIILETIAPVATGGGRCENSPTIIIGKRDICLIGIVPADHPSLSIIFMPQVVMLESLTFMQVVLWVVMASDQPLLLLLFEIIHCLELLPLIT